MRSRRALAICLLTVLFASCGQMDAKDEPGAIGRIDGRVLAGPQCPVVIDRSPCPDAPWHGTVRAVADDGSEFESPTDEQGSFSFVNLVPGSYAVTAEVSVPSSTITEQVSVNGEASTPVTLRVDTGIR
jgi:hypothetical protein